MCRGARHFLWSRLNLSDAGWSCEGRSVVNGFSDAGQILYQPWSVDKINHALSRGPHKSCMGHLDFLYEEVEDMINKGQWLILPASAAKELPGLRYSTPGVVPQRGRRSGVLMKRPYLLQLWSLCNLELLKIVSFARSSSPTQCLGQCNL